MQGGSLSLPHVKEIKYLVVMFTRVKKKTSLCFEKSAHCMFAQHLKIHLNPKLKFCIQSRSRSSHTVGEFYWMPHMLTDRSS